MTTAPARISVRRNRAGFLEAQGRRGTGRRGAHLASFLQSDIQGDGDAAHRLLVQVAAARRGDAPQPEAVGNAFAITIGPDGATIRNVVLADAPAERYTLDELATALATWIAAIGRAGGATA